MTLHVELQRLLLAIEMSGGTSGRMSADTDDDLAGPSGLDAVTVAAGLEWLASAGLIWVFGPEETGAPWRLIVVAHHPSNLAVLRKFPLKTPLASPEVRAAVLAVLRLAAFREFAPT